MNGLVCLERDGVAVVLDCGGTGLPRVLHWGEPLGPLTPAGLNHLRDAVLRQTPPGRLDAAWDLTLAPLESDGFAGRPAMQLRRDGVLLHPAWVITGSEATDSSLRVRADDRQEGLELVVELEIRTGGLVWLELALTNADGGSTVEVEHLEATLPFSSSATHLTTFDGRWAREKQLVTTALPAGAVTRQSRRGRPGHDAPTMFIATAGEPRWTSGEAWAAHVTWPADVTYRLDNLTEHAPLLGGGELLRPGELVLGPGESYRAPAVAYSHSISGLDGVAARFHTWLRSRPEHPHSPRPLTLNTWEAVYFDHDPARLRELADLAASVGVERFVLDDGWFLGRRDDTTSLGDWVVDRTVHPEGLGPLAAHVHSLGMQFGLWFEPEMVSLDSDLARAHPEWLLHHPNHLQHPEEISWRNQYVLDLADDGAYAHVLGQMDALVSELGIDFIKWDHNRDLVQATHAGRPGCHAQTAATLRLIAELKSRHPGLEIESCSSGGARSDLGIMAVCDRIWASDCNDPVERQEIQRHTGLLLPPELVGAHVGPGEAHSTGRVTPLSYRLATSLMGCAGIEWDIAECDPGELERIRAFAELYRELRGIIHTGRVCHPELRDPAWRVTGFVAPDAERAVFFVATIASPADARPERLRLPGLLPGVTYRVRVRDEIGRPATGAAVPPWFAGDGVELSGSVLATVGLQLPQLWPVQAFCLDITAVAPSSD